MMDNIKQCMKVYREHLFSGLIRSKQSMIEKRDSKLEAEYNNSKMPMGTSCDLQLKAWELEKFNKFKKTAY